MTETHGLSSRIANRMERHQRELSEQQKRINGSMKELLAQRDRLAAVANRMMETVVHPRMEELIRHFDNATIMDCHGDADFHCVCKFAHTPRFPATVSLDVVLLPGVRHAELTARYDLEILPVLMDYTRDEEASFPFDGSDEAIGLWVEDRIEQFLDTYLRLETHPLYQKDNLVTDPVCGMRISSIAATSKIEWPGHTIYFCSDICKEAFQKEH